MVRYTPLAIDQLDAISAYLNERSPRGARSVAQALKRTIADIAGYPYLGRSGRTPGIRVKPAADPT